MCNAMCSVCENACGCDCDEVFAYNTVKVVRVKDRYLGLIRYGSMAGIFVYIFVFVLILSKKYLQIEVPVGSVNTSLLKPTNGTEATRNIWDTNVSSFMYCDQYTGPRVPPFEKGKDSVQECVVWDETDMFFPPDEPSAMFVTTRVSIEEQMPACPDLSKPCKYPWDTVPNSTKSVLFPAAVEDFTIRIQHSFQASQFFRETGDDMYALDSGEMTGKMVNSKGEVVKTFGLTMDIVALGELVDASGSDLDAISTNVGADPDETNRHGGMLVFVIITYDNVNSNGNDIPTYTMYPTVIPGAQYKVVEARYTTTAEGEKRRTLLDRHGVKIQFLIGGQIGRFNFQVMLIQLVSALGLLSVATLVVEMLMLYVMPHKKFYNKYKFQETVDFSDVRDSEIAGNAEFTAQLHGDLAGMRESVLLSDGSYGSTIRHD